MKVYSGVMLILKLAVILSLVLDLLAIFLSVYEISLLKLVWLHILGIILFVQFGLDQFEGVGESK